MSIKKPERVDINEMRRELVGYYIAQHRNHVVAEDCILAQKPTDPVRQERHRLAIKMLNRELNANLKEIYDLKKRGIEDLYWEMDSVLHPAKSKTSDNSTPTLDHEVIKFIESFLKD